MRATVYPSVISGTILAPASKSVMQRACAAALLRNGKTIIKNSGKSNDDKAALDIIQSLGATVNVDDIQLEIISEGINVVSERINCGESGLSCRMFTPIAALSNKNIQIHGCGSLLKRPMNFFENILPQLNVKVISNDGCLPMSVQGPLLPRNIEVDGSLSSQFLTGLLMAYSAANACGVSIKVNDLKSKPYIDLTLQVLKDFGLKVPENKNYAEFYFASQAHILPANKIEYFVEGDWSGAAFLLVAAAISGKVIVKGLNINSCQADKMIIDVLKQSGASIYIQQDQIEVVASALKPFHFDATDCPDLFPPLVALAAYCEGVSVIEGTSRLSHKESNRAITLQEEFSKLGINIELKNNLMYIYGGGPIKSGIVHSHHDHRIAMATAVAALKADGEVIIENADAINKSYPNFFEHLKLLGTTIYYAD